VIRRLRARTLATLAAAAVLVSTLGSCSTFSRNDVVASLDDRELSRDDFEQMAGSELARQIVGEAPGGDRIAGDAARALITAWIVSGAVSETTPIDAAALDAADALGAEQFGPEWTDTPDVVRDLLRLNIAIGELNATGGIDADAARDLLADGDVYVDPRYGRWDAEAVTVTSLGVPQPTTPTLVIDQ